MIPHVKLDDVKYSFVLPYNKFVKLISRLDRYVDVDWEAGFIRVKGKIPKSIRDSALKRVRKDSPIGYVLKVWRYDKDQNYEQLG